MVKSIAESEIKIDQVLMTVQPIVWLPAHAAANGEARTIPAGSFVRVLYFERNYGREPDRVVLQKVGYQLPENRGLPETSIGSWGADCFKL